MFACMIGSMILPDFSRLCVTELQAPVGSGVRGRWLAACGDRPAFHAWGRLRGRGKAALLHEVSAEADDDSSEAGAYVTVYEQVDTDDLPRGVRSVEHVVPRSHVNGRAPGPAEDDPLGWVQATRLANSRRSNHPLYLWPDPEGKLAPPGRLVRVDGEWHYVPPREQRARLARKWLFVRATYPEGMRPPTAAQRRHAAQIVALAKNERPGAAEVRANAIYRREYGWANPLIEEGAAAWFSDPAWRALAFGF